MPEQLEFDLVSPHLAEDPNQRELIEEAQRLLSEAKCQITLAKISAALHHQDSLLYASPGNELAELRVLIGEAAFKKSRRCWERRLKANAVAVRKVIVVLKQLLQNN